MAKYEVIEAWVGVEKGDILELETVSPFIRANVRPLTAKVDSGNDADLKKEITALKSKLTKAENALESKEAEYQDQIAMLQGRIVELENEAKK